MLDSSQFPYTSCRTRLLCVGVGLLLASIVVAEGAPPVSTPQGREGISLAETVEELKSPPWAERFSRSVAEYLAPRLNAALEEGEMRSAAPNETGVLREDLAATREELAAVRSEFELLRETLNLLVGEIMDDLRNENSALREEMRAMHERQSLGLPDTISVPRPGGELVDSVLEDAALPTEDMALPAAPFSFSILKEWGRSPEVARELPGSSTLKGIVGMVPANSAPQDLEQLGRDLRTQFAAYDNINIEVFDEAESARNYAEQPNVANPVHRVLSVSKHAASGRDIILLIQNGIVREVSF